MLSDDATTHFVTKFAQYLYQINVDM